MRGSLGPVVPTSEVLDVSFGKSVFALLDCSPGTLVLVPVSVISVPVAPVPALGFAFVNVNVKLPARKF